MFPHFFTLDVTYVTGVTGVCWCTMPGWRRGWRCVYVLLPSSSWSLANVCAQRRLAFGSYEGKLCKRCYLPSFKTIFIDFTHICSFFDDCFLYSTWPPKKTTTSRGRWWHWLWEASASLDLYARALAKLWCLFASLHGCSLVWFSHVFPLILTLIVQHWTWAWLDVPTMLCLRWVWISCCKR